jgi:hypothetical protein
VKRDDPGGAPRGFSAAIRKDKCLSGRGFFISASGRKGFHMAEVEIPETVQYLDSPHRVEEHRYFRSDHIYLVAFLVCCGNKIIGRSQTGGRTAFVFEKTAELSADVAGFMAGSVVPARQFCF